MAHRTAIKSHIVGILKNTDLYLHLRRLFPFAYKSGSIRGMRGRIEFGEYDQVWFG